jgi:hypothetical protein
MQLLEPQALIKQGSTPTFEGVQEIGLFQRTRSGKLLVAPALASVQQIQFDFPFTCFVVT